MAVESTLTLFTSADISLQINVKQSDLTTPQVMTGWALGFVLRSSDGRLILNKATGGQGVTVGNGSGTDDRATVALADTDTTGWPSGRSYEWALWRTDDGTDIPLAYGPATLQKAAAQV